ncbi:hypothetical protein SARC_05574 [Sphaeroforma arctica JP610]|uniref:Phospholipid/glycerol acyltransferase domain-containing protein n=1 Tax=Sphaeroforma arctica JP610 TaxID=667725 RepID=A0A0L0FZZ3_9EUKA|nr:hypothetical protein SARC_05574 [Sphaeroforma arctica JP610]KNC82136.1 hypothetical protein SARC_05574 [Sphaeroforma arctica JP610]|eukprot:XP_014156038.1 hypothetical protein SARC_05574 [Sphaeroforma arctica JP610]
MKGRTRPSDDDNILAPGSLRSVLFSPIALMLSFLPKFIRETIYVIWFNICLVNSIFFLYTCCLIVQIYYFNDNEASVKARRHRCAQLCHYFFRYGIFFPCPWITVDHPKIDWSCCEEDKVATLINHTSYLDAILYSAVSPPNIIPLNKTLMKASIFKLPFMGKISTWVGHFPVHFTSEQGSSVDQTQQKPVMEAFETYVTEGGGLTFCPEGTVNAKPYEMLSWRTGGFRITERNNMKYVFFTHVGCDKVWGPKAKVGGYPANLKLSVSAYEDNSKESNDPVEKEKLFKAKVSHMQKMMQQEINALLSWVTHREFAALSTLANRQSLSSDPRLYLD